MLPPCLNSIDNLQIMPCKYSVLLDFTLVSIEHIKIDNISLKQCAIMPINGFAPTELKFPTMKSANQNKYFFHFILIPMVY